MMQNLLKKSMGNGLLAVHTTA